MATNADSMFPTASGLIRAEYPVTTPRDSSRRTRDWTADTENPAAAARWASVARPSATSSRAKMRSISSRCSPASTMAVDLSQWRHAGRVRMTRRVETWQLAPNSPHRRRCRRAGYTTAETATRCYEDFLPASAAGIFRSNLDTDTQAAEATDNSDYSLDWLAGQIGHHIHDPYDLYEKVASS